MCVQNRVSNNWVFCFQGVIWNAITYSIWKTCQKAWSGIVRLFFFFLFSKVNVLWSVLSPHVYFILCKIYRLLRMCWASHTRTSSQRQYCLTQDYSAKRRVRISQYRFSNLSFIIRPSAISRLMNATNKYNNIQRNCSTGIQQNRSCIVNTKQWIHRKQELQSKWTYKNESHRCSTWYIT